MTTYENLILFPIRVIGAISLIGICIHQKFFKKDLVFSCKFCELGACNCKLIIQPHRTGGKSGEKDAMCYDKDGNILDGIYKHQPFKKPL